MYQAIKAFSIFCMIISCGSPSPEPTYTVESPEDLFNYEGDEDPPRRHRNSNAWQNVRQSRWLKSNLPISFR
jgi:hypothetical protein